MKKNAFKFVAFLVVALIVLSGVNGVLRFKYVDGNYTMETFYRLPENSVDVLVLGSSHAFESFDPAVLWAEEGIAAYDLGGALQQLWNSYHYLVEALQTQSPKLIVLDLSYCKGAIDYEIEAMAIKNTFGLKPSQNKLDNFRASFHEADLWKYLIEPAAYHGRYADLSRADFLPDLGNKVYGESWKGFALNTGTTPFPAPEIRNDLEPFPLYDKVDAYYRKILALAEELEIPMLTVLAPYANHTPRSSAKYLMAGMIAEEYGADYVDFNLMYEDFDFDFATDMADENHLNHRGSQKFSSYFAQYLKENYDLPDQRGNPRYVSWDQNAAYMKSVRRHVALSETKDLGEYLAMLENREDLAIVITQEGEDAGFQTLLSPHGIEIPGGGALVILGGQVSYQGSAQELLYHAEWGSSDVAIKRAFANEPVSIVFDRQEMRKVVNGLNFLVYDLTTDSLADAVGFSASKEYAAVR